MKKLLLFLLLISLRIGFAQTYVLIPDANFAAWLQGAIPSAMNGNSLNITSTLVTTSTQSIHIPSANISNLTGLQYFTSLTSLYCHSNLLTSLPPLPNTIKTIGCWSNSLTSLPTLPDSLTALACQKNALTSLPSLPNKLTFLNCKSNSLTSLPALPDSINILGCDSNNIKCFPPFPSSIDYISLTNNPFTCLPNYVLPAMNSYTTYPSCVVGNTNGCAVVGLSELTNDGNSWIIYPNPAKDKVFIEFSDAITSMRIKICDALGREVLNFSEVKTRVELNLLGLRNGIYFVILTNDRGEQTIKKLLVAYEP